MNSRAISLALMSLVVILTGCSSAERETAEQAAIRFYGAVHDRQGEQACSLLAPSAAEGLSTGGQRCAGAVLDLELPGGRPVDTEVWGDEAQVRLSRDTVFLHRFPQGWLVRGAGCTARDELPYRCEVTT